MNATDYPLDQLHALPYRLAKQPGRWALISSGQLTKDEAEHLRTRLRQLGLEARVHEEPTGFKTLARIAP